jgi:hypothetical protein
MKRSELERVADWSPVFDSPSHSSSSLLSFRGMPTLGFSCDDKRKKKEEKNYVRS